MEFKIRRCRYIYIEPREVVDLDLRQLLNLSDRPETARRWVAIAPHLEDEVDVSEEELLLLGAVGYTHWRKSSDLAQLNPSVVRSLIAKGLLLTDESEDDSARRKDSSLRTSQWWMPALFAWTRSRWGGIDAVSGTDTSPSSMDDMMERFGFPPDAVYRRADWNTRIPLPKPAHTDFDALLALRTTTRNFDTDASLGNEEFSQMMYRGFGATHRQLLSEGAEVLKRSSPSGGGLHPVEPYVLVVNVEGLSPGIYHYQGVDHVMEMSKSLDISAARQLALTMVAGQPWFADAAALVVLAVRFDRHQWKYRNHPKAFRVMNVEVGHFSQTLYLSAAELGLGAFVTVAINEKQIEEAFEFDGLEQGCLAVCGFGPQTSRRSYVEYDPKSSQWVDEDP